MGFTRHVVAEAELPSQLPRLLPRTERIDTEEQLPGDVQARYSPTMVLPPPAGEKRADIATDDTRLGPTATDEGQLAQRLTRDRIHRALFGELAQAPTIGRYTFLKELGQGGMGVVCTAYDPKLDRKVAIKLTRSLATASADSRARILREAQAMARLSHPNVVQVYEVGELGEELFVAMEFIDGVDLAQWLGAQRRGWREVQRVFLEAGRGLAAAHAAGLVHRDFKPANVFVGADGRVIVGDFGLARASGARVAAAPAAAVASMATRSELASPLTATGALLGTPAYMAPEAFEHDTSDAATDQFAFCVALFEALYGVRPFAGRDVAGLVHAVMKTEPAIPAGAEVPGWLQQVVLRGLRKRPAERWPSMPALLSALAFDPAARARGLRRGALAVSLVGASVVGFGWLAAAAGERAEQEATAKRAAETARDEAFDGLRVAAQRSELEAARARDALRLAALRRFDTLGTVDHVDDPTSAAALLREVEAPAQLRGWRSSAVEALEQPIAKVVVPGWMYAAFTPDGARVVTQNENKSVSVWRTDGAGAPVTFGAREGGWLGEFALSPDGRRVALGYRDGVVRVHAIDGSGEAVELRGPGDQVTDLGWRDDGSQLLVNTWQDQTGVTLLRSQLLQVDAPGTKWVDLPGRTAFIPGTGMMIADGIDSPYWGPAQVASVLRGDGGVLAEFPGSLNIEAAPTGDAVLLVGERALQRRGLDGAALGPAFDHAPLLAADDKVATATFTPDGARVISTTSEERVFVWDAASGKLLREIEAPPPPQPGMLMWGLRMVVSPDSALLARGYADRTVRVWDLDGRHAPTILRGHLHAPSGLAFSPDSRTLATTTIYTRGFSKTQGLQRERGDFEQTLRLWPLPTARTLQISAHTTSARETDLRWISTSPWTPDGRALLLSEGLTLKLFDRAGASIATTVVPAQHEYVREPLFTADGRFATLQTARGWVRWDLREPSRLTAVELPAQERATEAAVRNGRGGAALSSDGALVSYVSAGRDQVRVYRFDTQALVRQLDHGAIVERVEFSPDGERVMTLTKDRRVRVWSLVDDAPPAVHEVEGDRVAFPQWSPDGEFVAVAEGTAIKDEFAFVVWRPGESVRPAPRITTSAVAALTRVSPDGRHLAIVGRDDRIRLVSSEGELVVRELDPVDSEPGRLEFSRDGAWIVSGGSNAAFVWSTVTGAVVRVLRSPERQLSLASFEPTGTSVLLGGRDGVVTIVPFDAAVARADLQTRLREATTYCYSQARRRIDLNEPPALAWANFAACERGQGRDPGAAPAEVAP